MNEAQPTGTYVQLLGETYYRIADYDQMPPFFMTLVSGADHWLFISSTGGLTAGRTHADLALFPYETEDKLTANSSHTGSKTVFLVTRNGRIHLWEPFSACHVGVYRCQRNLYKNIYGNKLVFEEVNHDLGLTWRTAWRTGDRFGFIRSSWLRNDGDAACQVSLLDGLQNVLPYGATVAMQTSLSSLLHAYKRSEVDAQSGLATFALSATLTDQAEPSESLRTTAVWQVGLDHARYLLSVNQLDAFRHGLSIQPEQDIRGRAGAYLVNAELELAAAATHAWHVVADVNQDSADVVSLAQLLLADKETIVQQLEADIDAGTAVLLNYVAAADGLQQTAEPTTGAHHFANVMFNVMRGGIFNGGYQVEKQDLLDFVATRNRPLAQAHAAWLAALPDKMTVDDLYAALAQAGVPDLVRLGYEYLPLTFSRRHGDPSRPWNQFAINLKQPDGSPRLDYQGNWRDIFQNWEPLALAFPAYVEGIIAKFLNATTADGYNPYRVTRDGIEWEVPEPSNPWANIGYWSDHQIIYLQKLLEIAQQAHPGTVQSLWNRPVFAYANVPYRLRPYPQMLADWYNTIDFDWELERTVETAVAAMGTDGRLLRDESGQVIHVTMMEKLLVLLLAKLTNLVPEGGIWMNTQRPEWNDANNALVGKGLSVVTTAYLRRFIAFWQAQLVGMEATDFMVNTAVADLFAQVQAIFAAHQPHLAAGFGSQERRIMMDELGTAASGYRAAIYADGLSATQTALNGQTIAELLALAQAYIEQTLRANRRADALYHAYNILHVHDQGVDVEHLYLMLEGQVAILSSGMLAADEALALLHSLRHSDLYRADQHTYLLYPNRDLPGFRQKNNVAAAQVAASPLVTALHAAGDTRLLIRDAAGVYHFNGGFRNDRDVARTLDVLAQEPAYAHLVAAERDAILNLFEMTFAHRAFTGRSGTFFAYEGLGSTYWHMVAKLLLAVQECYRTALDEGAATAVTTALAAAYYDIRAGLGFNKSPAEYGAFPTDPYSHTPAGRGAQQPGMTGQVKEEILTRWGELGVFVQDGVLHFAPTLLRSQEFLHEPGCFVYVDDDGQQQTLSLPAHALAFTFCQTPIVYILGDVQEIEVVWGNGRTTRISGHSLDADTSRHIFARDEQVKTVYVTVHMGKRASG
ncbi:MAG: hypothetical protein H6660_18165 [Ardenticatenaceae bacterium]|nr:hypothetical protein [Ardenticatenaceae bacterium]